MKESSWRPRSKNWKKLFTREKTIFLTRRASTRSRSLWLRARLRTSKVTLKQQLLRRTRQSDRWKSNWTIRVVVTRTRRAASSQLTSRSWPECSRNTETKSPSWTKIWSRGLKRSNTIQKNTREWSKISTRNWLSKGRPGQLSKARPTESKASSLSESLSFWPKLISWGWKKIARA